MYNNIKKNKKALIIISMVILVYILTLSFGYAFFQEELKISGNVSTASGKPKDCPLEMQKFRSVGNYGINDYFLESYHALSGGGALEDFLKDLMGGINSYDKDKNIASFYTRTSFLIDYDIIGSAEFSTNSLPIYIALKNVSSYDLENWVIMPDMANIREPIVNSPLDYFNISYEVFDGDLNTWKPHYWDDWNYQYFDVNPSVFLYSPLLPTPFDFHNLTDGSIEYNVHEGYSVKEFYDDYWETGLNFKTEPVATGKYLILGIVFPKVSTNAEALTEPEGIAFKIYPSNFSEESAFRVRMAFDDLEVVNNFRDSVGKDFETNPSLYPYPVEWWNRQ